MGKLKKENNAIRITLCHEGPAINKFSFVTGNCIPDYLQVSFVPVILFESSFRRSYLLFP